MDTKKGRRMRIVVIAVALGLTGCASDGWRYMAPPKGTYSLSVDGARNNPAGANDVSISRIAPATIPIPALTKV